MSSVGFGNVAVPGGRANAVVWRAHADVSVANVVQVCYETYACLLCAGGWRPTSSNRYLAQGEVEAHAREVHGVETAQTGAFHGGQRGGKAAGMADAKILEVLARYEEYARDVSRRLHSGLPSFAFGIDVAHIGEMIPKMRGYLAEGRREKVMRHLGFIQGTLVAHRVYTLDEVKAHNKPDEDPR